MVPSFPAYRSCGSAGSRLRPGKTCCQAQSREAFSTFRASASRRWASPWRFRSIPPMELPASSSCTRRLSAFPAAVRQLVSDTRSRAPLPSRIRIWLRPKSTSLIPEPQSLEQAQAAPRAGSDFRRPAAVRRPSSARRQPARLRPGVGIDLGGAAASLAWTRAQASKRDLEHVPVGGTAPRVPGSACSIRRALRLPGAKERR